MRIWLPTTMAGLVASGCLLTCVPVLVALFLAGTALQDLSEKSDSLVKEGLTVIHLGIDLSDRLADLRRNARQFLAVRDQDLLGLVDERWQEIDVSLRELRARQVSPELRSEIEALQKDLHEARDKWDRGAANDRLRIDATELLSTGEARAASLVNAGRVAIDREMETLRISALEANGLMLGTVFALVPVTALLTLGFSVAVTRPLQTLARSIAELGHASYNRPVVIEFPREMRRLAVQLDWLRRRLAQLEADKDRFLQHMSHELKTPLASLSEGADLLNDRTLGELTPRQTEVAKILAESANELEGSINNLLSYAEWRAERRQADMHWFDARVLIDDVLSAHRLPMARRELKVELRIHNQHLFGQRSRLRIALDNLVTNAIKHAPDGSALELSADVHDRSCELSVRDFGAGVPDHEKKRIFEPFVRGGSALEQGIRGTGVGLSIVTETMVSHGGTVQVEDAGPGARFRMVWPCPDAGAES